MMTRKTSLLSTTAALALSAQSTAAVTSDKKRWYPVFVGDYDAGKCTTNPSEVFEELADSDLLNFAFDDKEGCCHAWFPDQESCECLGGGCDSNDEQILETPSPPKELYWFPIFDVEYEGGRCVRQGSIKGNEAPSYYTVEGGFLHKNMEDCCSFWFGEQINLGCFLDEVEITLDPSDHVNATFKSTQGCQGTECSGLPRVKEQ